MTKPPTNNRINSQRNRGGGPIKTPEADIAHIRWCRERKGMTFVQISKEFDGRYTPRYIKQVCEYEVRPFIEPKNKDDDDAAVPGDRL